MKYLMVVLLALCLALIISPHNKSKADGGEGKKLFEKKCGTCHPLDRPKSQKKTADEWESTVKRMKDSHRAPLKDDEANVIIEYLTKQYGK